MMAGLYGPLLNRDERSVDHLPTLNELGSTARCKLALIEVRARVKVLEAQLQDTGTPLPVDALTYTGSDEKFKPKILKLHIKLLGRLEANAPALATAYSFGRALCDTCCGPDDQRSVSEELGRQRVRELVGWLDDVRSVIPPEAAQAVATSLTWWSEWIAAFTKVRGGWKASRQLVLTALRHQGERWRILLASDASELTALTLDGYIQAAETAAMRLRRVATRLVIRFWIPLLVILAVTAGLVWLAVNETSGAAKVWSTFGTLAAGLGVTGGSIRTGLQKMASTAGEPLWSVSRSEALAAEITQFPTFDLGSALRHTLRKEGIVATLLPSDGRRKLFGDRTTRWRGLSPPTSEKQGANAESQPVVAVASA